MFITIHVAAEERQVQVANIGFVGKSYDGTKAFLYVQGEGFLTDESYAEVLKMIGLNNGTV